MALVVNRPDSDVATPDQLALAAEYEALKSQEAALKKQIEALQDRIVRSMGEPNKVTKPDGRPLFTLSPTTTKGKWDSARLRADGLEDEYWIPGGTVTGTRLTVTP